MIDLVWRQGQPQTARFVKNWVHRQFWMMVLGLPAYRVSHLQCTPGMFADIKDDPVAIARDVETYLGKL